MMKWQRFILLLTILLLVVGCGAIDTKAAAPQPTTMEVTRSSVIAQNHLPPFSRTITDAGAVQRLYTAAQNLPKTRVQRWMCPLPSTIVYHVQFLEGKTVLQQWNMDAIGCAVVMLHKGDLRRVNSAFVSLFAKTIGLTKLY